MKAKESFELLAHNIQSLNLALGQSAATAINKHVTCRSWLVGYRIIHYEQNGCDRAKYGEMLLKKLAEKLKDNNFSQTNLKLYRQFYLIYSYLLSPVKEYLEQLPSIGQTLSDQLQLIELQEKTISQSLTDQFEPGEFQEKAIGQSLIGQFKTDKFQEETMVQLDSKDPIVPPKLLFERLSFTHFVQLLPLKDELERAFYATECIKGTWSVRELKRQIGSHYFERCGLSRDKAALSMLVNNHVIQSDLKEVIKSPFTFEFLGLNAKDVVEESDLESALMDHLQDFMLELGSGFCFESRQKRILIDNNYYFYDLLFYNRLLHCGVIVELKSHELDYRDVAQLNMYLAYYRKHLMVPGDNLPVGILLCTRLGEEMVEYATIGIDENLFISQYLLRLPSREELETWLRRELRMCRK